MSIKCVYKPSYPGEELDNFNEIQNHFGWSEKVTAIKIGTWQTIHDIDDRYPSIEEMTEYENKQYSIEQEMQQIKDQAIANGTFMKAPNGKPTNLTERQWLQVRTKAFKDWFGDWESLAESHINTLEILNKDSSINFDKLEELSDEYFKNADESLFNKGRKTLRERQEHHKGESNTLEHIQNVVKSAQQSNVSDNLKQHVVIAAALHDLAKPFHRGNKHGFQSEELLNKIFKGKVSGLARFAIAHHMMTIEEGETFTRTDAERIVNDAIKRNLDVNEAIDVLIALHIADITRGRNLEDIDEYSNKSVRDVINNEVENKRQLLKEVANTKENNNVSKVVDENGEPLVVYHGTNNNDFYTFKTVFDVEREDFNSKKSQFELFANDYLLKNIVGTRKAPYFEDIDIPNYINDIFFNEGNLESNYEYHDFGELLISIGKDIWSDFIKSIPATKYSYIEKDYKHGIYFSSDKTYAENWAKFQNGDRVIPCFLNIKNPIYTETPMIEGEMEGIFVQDGNNKSDGVIGHDAITGEIAKSNGVEYLIRKPNQAKSATDNIGTFSRENDNIYQNKALNQNQVAANLIQNVVKDLVKTDLAHYRDSKLRVSKQTGLQTPIMKAGLVKENEQIIQQQINGVYDFLESNGIPHEAISINPVGETYEISIDEKLVQVHLNNLSDTISRNYADSNFNNAFTTIQEVNKMRNILAFLSEKVGLTYQFISYKDAKKLNKGITENTNAFVLDNKVYFIQGKALDMDIIAEEMLHPFVASIKLSNLKAFNSLLRDAKKAYPKLRLEINAAYENNKDEELVTQALSRAFREDKTAYPKGHPIKELIKHFIQYLKTHIFTKASWNQVIPEEITAEMLDTNITIEELARIVNSELKIYSGYIPGLRENKYNRAEETINIYAGAGENAELSNFAERPFDFSSFTNDDFFNLKSEWEFLDSDGVEEFLASTSFDSVEQAFQAIKAAYARGYYINDESEEGRKNEEKCNEIIDKILASKNPSEIKKLGRTIPMGKVSYSSKTILEDWDVISSKTMEALIEQSFRQNPQARQKLFETGYATLTHTQDKGKWGTEFPRILMEVRNRLMSEYNHDPNQLVMNFEESTSQPTSQEPTTEQPIDTHQEESPVNMSLDYKMRQEWNPQTVNHRTIRIVQLFESVVDDLEKDLPDIEKLNSSSATRQYIITARYGSGNILNKVKEKIQNLYVDRDYVTETVHSIYSEKDWDTQEVVDKIDHICKQGQLMLEYFEPLCFEASAEIKRREGVSILTKDGEVVNTSEEMQMTDEEFMTKHEEGWFFEPHEQSMEDVIEAETVSILSNLYEVDKDGNYIKFDDLEEPLPIDFRMALVTVAKIVGNCTSDIQMIPAIKKAAGKFIWMNQILNNLLGVDTETSHLYDGITEEDARLKKQNLCSIFWKDMHKIFVLIEEQVIDDDGNIKCNILNKVEGSDALLKVFEDVCYSNKTLFSDDGKPYKAVYNSDGSFNQQVYDKLHEELAKSSLYYRLPLLDINQEDIDLVDRLLKAFGVDISKNNIAILLNKNDLTEQREAKVNELTKILFGFYAPNKAQNQPLQSVIKNSDTTSIFDAFEVNYRTLADIFGDQSAGFEESQARLTVDNEQKSLFSRIYPNLISTIVNKLKNVDELSDINYRKRLERDYGNNWWFAPIKNKFRKGLIKDLYESEQDRRMLRVSTLKASNGVSYKQEIDAQAEETRLNQFENTSDETNNFREYSVPTFSDAGESYYMRLRYFDIKDNKKWNELLDRYCDVARQEIDRIRVVKARAKDKNIIPISGFDEFGDKFNYLPFLNDTLDFNEFNKLSDNPDEQHNYLKELITQGLEKEFEYYLSRYNSWQVNDLPKSKHTEDSKQRNGIINVIDTILKNRSNNPITLEQNILINNIKNKLRRNTMTLGQFELLKQDIANILTSNIPDSQWKDSVLSKIASFTISTSNLDKLKDYFYNSFYANTQILNITMRDPAFLGSADKLQKRFKMFYSPVSTCYTCEYSYNDQGQIVLNTDKNNSLIKETEYSLVLQDDILKEAFSMENIETLIRNRVTDGYLNSAQAKEILKNFKDINRSDAQCYRTLPSWQMCLNMIGKGYNKKMQQSIDRLSNGTWSYEDYHNVWEIFKPFVASYAKKPSGLENNDDFNEQFDTIETPIMHKNSEFLLLAMYSAMSGEIKNNWKLKALNEFMVKHGIDKVQFESAVKVGAQGLININECETPEQLTATLEAYTGLHNNDQAENGNKQVITAIPFNTWGISTAMPEHLLEHEESSMGTQMMKIIMEGLSEDPNKTVKIGNETKTYQQVLQLYQAIHVQNLKDSFEKVGKKFADNRELSEYLKNQILSQNKFSNDLLYHLELDKDGNFIHPIIDPMLRNQFDSLIASLVRNNVTKRFIRMGALPQVASYGFDDLQLRFADEHGNLLLTQKEFEENHNEDNPATISYYRSIDDKQEKVTITFDTWDKYHEYAKEHSNTIKYMEVLIPPFDNNFMSYINDAFIYKNDVKNKEGKVIHKSGEFNHELFNKSIDKKLLEGIGNRVPTETKHSMIPIYVKGFLPSQNSSCVVTPAEWIAISDSDNDGDKLYTYFYHSEIFFDQKKAKEEFAKHKKFTYMPKEKRNSIRVSSSEYMGEDYKKSNELDIMWDIVMKNYNNNTDYLKTLTTYGVKNNERYLKSTTDFSANNEDARYRELKEFIDQARSMVGRFTKIRPVMYHVNKLDRLEGESDSDYKQRCDIESIKDNSHEARNNKMLDLMISILRTEDNSAQILIPGGFPIIKDVSDKMKKLKHIEDNACSLCNPAVRTTQQVNNMAGRNLIGIYANHRSVRPLLEMSKLVLNKNNRPNINNNRSLPRVNKNISWSLSAIKNNRGEFISDNISNFSGASVDNAKDPRLGHLGQNEVTAPISMLLIHLGYTIEEVASFISQPAVVECVRDYILNGRKGFLIDIVRATRIELENKAKGRSHTTETIDGLPLSVLDDQIERNAMGIVQNADDCLIQARVLENLEKLLPASDALNQIINVTKADTQVGALKARSSENKIKIQKIQRLIERTKESKFPLVGADKLIPRILDDIDVENSQIPYVSGFRFWGIESIVGFSKKASMTFSNIADSVHNAALTKTDALTLNADTIDGLTDATVSYIFSSLPLISGYNRDKRIRATVNILNDIKRKRLLDDNPLIRDLVANTKGNKYSKNYPFIKLNKNIRKNVSAVDIYKGAWRSLIVNGNKELNTSYGTITQKDLSDLLFAYCFSVNGLSSGNGSFMHCFPESEIDSIDGYNDLVKRLENYETSDEIVTNILDQYIANNPQNSSLVHRIDTRKTNIKDFLKGSKVVPNTIIIENFNNNQFVRAEWESGGTEYYTYPYVYFTDEIGRRYLYKGYNIRQGELIYKRMQVLGNTKNGFLEEYEMGKSAIMGQSNCIESVLKSNSNTILDSKLKNEFDIAVQQMSEKGDVITQEDHELILNRLLGNENIKEKGLEDYESGTKDRTGMVLCL